MSSAALTWAMSAERGAALQSGWRSVVAGGIGWRLRMDYADRLVGPEGLKWTDWRKLGQVEIVKTGPHRTVYHVRLPEGDYYVKHFRAADWRARLRNLVRRTQASREFEAAQRIAGLGLPTFEPLALGEACHWPGLTDSLLVNRAIPGTVPLDRYLSTDFAGLSPQRRSELRQRLACELGRIAARLHAAGVEHVDLHAGNLLLHVQGDDASPLLSLIDLHAVRFHSVLASWRRDRNLLALHQFFAGRSTRADRRRFWNAYCTALAAVEPSADGTGRDEDRGARLERLVTDAAEAAWRRADRAWQRGNRHVRRLDGPHVRCRGLAALDARSLESIRDAPELPFERHLIRWCKRSGSHQVAMVRVPVLNVAEAERRGTAEVRAVWKRIARGGWLSRLLSVGRMSAVRRAWEVGHALLRRGIETPRPLLYVETVQNSEAISYLLTEALESSETATEFFERRWPQLPPGEQSQWLRGRAASLARAARKLHEAGFDHRDLKFSNLLVSDDLADARVWLLDLDAVRRWTKLPDHRARQNLSRIDVSAQQTGAIGRAQRLRFLKDYLGPRFAGEWKEWWRQISRRSEVKIARNQRRGRPLS